MHRILNPRILSSRIIFPGIEDSLFFYWGYLVFGLRILGPWIDDFLEDSCSFDWWLFGGFLVLGLRIRNPRILNSRSLVHGLKESPVLLFSSHFSKEYAIATYWALPPWDLYRQGNSLRLTLFVSPRDWYIWQARPVQYISVFPNKWNQIPCDILY